MNESVWFNADSATVMSAALAVFARRGLYMVRSFDLRSAQAAHAACACPHHGTAQCTCQFVVLLIYGDAAQPVVLTVHCREAQTQANIVRDVTTFPDPRLSEQVMAALVEAALDITAPPLVAAEATPDAH